MTTSRATSAKTSDALNAVRELADTVTTEDQLAALIHMIMLADVDSSVRTRMMAATSAASERVFG